MKKILLLIFFIFLCEAVGFIATPITIQSIPTWYASLHKPFFNPPNSIFGPVWTTLYFLMGVSLFAVWQKGMQKSRVRRAVGIFALQLFLNLCWSFVFFGGKSIAGGLIVILLLLLLIIATIKLFYPLSKWAAYLLIPYAAWVSFATALNASLLFLNK